MPKPPDPDGSASHKSRAGSKDLGSITTSGAAAFHAGEVGCRDSERAEGSGRAVQQRFADRWPPASNAVGVHRMNRQEKSGPSGTCP